MERGCCNAIRNIVVQVEVENCDVTGVVEETINDRHDFEQRSFLSRETVTRMRQAKHQELGKPESTVNESGTCRVVMEALE